MAPPIQARLSGISWAPRSSSGPVTSPKPKLKRLRSKRLAAFFTECVAPGVPPGGTLFDTALSNVRRMTEQGTVPTGLVRVRFD